MSYIVQRNKPDRCTNCLFIDKITYDCKLMYGNDYPDFESQYANCPLIEIPTPHGDLVDRNKLLRKAKRESTYAWKMNLHARTETILNQFIDWLDSAEVIIKAERETK